MNTEYLLLIAIGVGAIAGAAISSLVFAAARQQQTAAKLSSWEVPQGVTSLMELLEVPAIIVDPSHNVMTASPLGYSLGFISQGRLVTPELVQMVDNLRDRSDSLTGEFEVARGPFGDASLSIFARASHYGIRFTLLLISDKTEFRRLDEVRRDFVANISHELKTPIGAVGLLAEAIEQAADDPKMVKHFADRLQTEGRRLAGITREIIELSRLQAEGALTSFEKVSIDDIISQAVDRNRVVATTKNVDVTVGGESRTFVYGDAGSLIVAVDNLISNALQYSPNNSRIGIGVTRQRDCIDIAVTDQGIGMTPDEAARVFERFYRTDQARSRTTGGTGLGLSIVKHTIQNHGGEVRVWSRPDNGSTFTIRLPEATEYPHGETP
ncbi:ATP-binding protein [Alpinimonas psychrophila]|uniref:Sensor-like histidine kinase SenX3 n=1 Tax=Alpinimonas psychrophila TaxID=748908 RepID=A0A7W3PML2_9MICO|nr:ATP-binding protein [Alpinimonas psychrophila]MBA8827974.1 two-component system sensor histidine kinase SenX3 [Alpinimonas psychrophila]